MSKTNFQKVKDFNEVFGVPEHSIPQTNISKENPDLTKLRLDLITEECKEFEEAVENHDFVEMVDALADILYVVYGAGSSFGVDLDKAFDIVHESNMSKVCKSEEEAKQTIQWYKENSDVYDSPAYRKKGEFWVVYNESTGKVLKSINYKKVQFDMGSLSIGA
tara:strand:+ start:50 stop:538 length:489 start_codon:yes stop_codon:yes gene_type:complete